MTAGTRYTAVAIVLHWAIAAAILANLCLGWWMHRAIEHTESASRAIAAFQLHKSLGLTVLALTLLRLAWRLLHRPPPLPEAMQAWERFVARAVHWAFYALLVVVPLSGWTYVSAQWRGDAPLNVPTLWFGLFEVPHLFDAGALDPAERKAIAARNFAAHFWLAWSMAGLLVLHVAAALKHRFVDRDHVLASMAPQAGLAIAGVALAAIAGALFVAPTTAAQVRVIGSAPGGWVVDPASGIAYAGTESGVPFRGQFMRWQADIRFDPRAASAVVVSATVDTASATDGVALHDETLLEPEWFDVASHPTAQFVATRIGPKPGGGLTIEGTLTIKGRAIPVPALDLTLGDAEILISGAFEIDRTDANLGMESDPAGEYVSRKIEVEVKVRATPP